MVIAGALCLCAAAASAFLGARALVRPAINDAGQALRAVAPTQLAAAVMLAVAGAVALSPRPSLLLLVLCVAGAVGTVVIGVWHASRYAYAVLRRDTACSRSAENPCATCTLSCR